MFVPMILVTPCELKYARAPLDGQRCVSDEAADMLHTDHHQCVWRCLMMKTCHYINHNSNTGQCELGLGQCQSLHSAAEIMANAFGPSRQGCFQWGSDQKPGQIPVQTPNGRRYAARVVSGNDVLIGSFYTSSRAFYGVRNNMVFGLINENDREIKILTKDPACPLPWMLYTAGEPLPPGAVTGGRLADGQPTHIAKIVHNNGDIAFGYYDTETVLAYYDYGSPQTTTSMYILVLL